jgi:K+-transporting ATPase ATPase A chain
MIEGWIQILLTVLIVIAITPVLGGYMARVFLHERTFLDTIASPVERLLYRLSGLRTTDPMTGWQYARSLLLSNVAMAILVYLIFMLQGTIPLNPTGLSAPTWDTALHTVISFVTNTNQQHYSGETRRCCIKGMR